MSVLEYVRKFDELSQYDASFNELIDQCLVIKQADQEKKEEKWTNKEIVDQGNFLTNHGKPPQITIIEREHRWPQIKIKMSA